MSKSKVMSWSEYMKKAFPDQPVTQAAADALQVKLDELAARAKAAGWTPEYVASLDSGAARKETP